MEIYPEHIANFLQELYQRWPYLRLCSLMRQVRLSDTEKEFTRVELLVPAPAKSKIVGLCVECAYQVVIIKGMHPFKYWYRSDYSKQQEAFVHLQAVFDETLCYRGGWIGFGMLVSTQDVLTNPAQFRYEKEKMLRIYTWRGTYDRVFRF